MHTAVTQGESPYEDSPLVCAENFLQPALTVMRIFLHETPVFCNFDVKFV